MFYQPRRYFYPTQVPMMKKPVETKEEQNTKDNTVIKEKEEKKDEKKKSLEELKDVLSKRLDKIEELFSHYKDPLLKINENVEELRKTDFLNKKKKREKSPIPKIPKEKFEKSPIPKSPKSPKSPILKEKSIKILDKVEKKESLPEKEVENPLA